jgi:hypothetical protein
MLAFKISNYLTRPENISIFAENRKLTSNKLRKEILFVVIFYLTNFYTKNTHFSNNYSDVQFELNATGVFLFNTFF